MTGYCDSLRQNCLLNEYHHKKSVRMTIAEFDALFAQLKDYFPLFTQKGTFSTLRFAYKEGIIEDRAQCWYTLFWMRNYPTYGAFASILGIHEKRVGQMLRRNVYAMKKCFEEQGKLAWPSEEEFLRQLEEARHNIDHPDLKDYVAVLDGTEPQIPRPADPAKESSTYSAKKKQHSRNVLILVWILTGLIIWVSATFRGAHDQRDFNRTDLRDRFIGKDYGLLADAGFTLNRVTDRVKIKGLTPRKKEKGQLRHDRADIIYNKMISQYRVIVENSIGQLKAWRVLKGVYRQHRESRHMHIALDDVVYVCTVLTNMQLVKKPLRAPGWKPKDKNGARRDPAPPLPPFVQPPRGGQ